MIIQLMLVPVRKMAMLFYDCVGRKVTSSAAETGQATYIIWLFYTFNTFLQTKLVLLETRIIRLSAW